MYVGVITAHREAAAATEELDDVTNDLLIGHLHDLELFHWFVRAHLESTGGDLSTEGARTEAGAARKAEEAAAGRSALTRSSYAVGPTATGPRHASRGGALAFPGWLVR